MLVYYIVLMLNGVYSNYMEHSKCVITFVFPHNLVEVVCFITALVNLISIVLILLNNRYTCITTLNYD